MDACYLPVKHESKLPKILEQIVTAKESEKDWVPYFNFMALPILKEITDLDPFLKALGEKRKFRSGVLRVGTSTVYNWQVEPRYLFSIEFMDEDKDLTYDELCKDIQGLNYGY